ncbi:hypothetical protein SAMN02800692_1059 [Luteibacter sp. UNC138MFCol5.1]|uniref:hypothetical protein n=1 Tax=Luteibacter sp. UNC138MFCol5.1 TaxID=1502774 RepID=UPI0008B49496|nr:hypothetical protein [Luteibacter sp. UNC138MFCol5.1]SEO54262.1 hypothetical protein SAMN02800692_1059 [Luteibacter sp. UNC138MFCol5.1]
MRRVQAMVMLLIGCLPLAGCYYDPDYGYVRNGTGADAYYGEETTVVSPGYGGGYYGGYGYGPGCCYSSLSYGTVWVDGYDGRRFYRDRYYRDRNAWRGPPPRGDWHGGHGDGRPGNWQGDRRPPGGWNRDDRDHRPPPGASRGGDRPPRNWQGNGDRPGGNWNRGGDRPQGNWNRGGQSRPAPPSGARPTPSQRQFGGGRDRSRFRSTTD